MDLNFSYAQFFDKTPGVKDTKSKTSYNLGHQVTCLYFWLDSEELAISRVETRVNEGGITFQKKLSEGNMRAV